jgi:hypothetical protein
MTMSDENADTHLSPHHRDTLGKILSHPTSHNVEWSDARKLLEAAGEVTVRHDGKMVVTLGGETEVFEDFGRKDLDTQQIVDLRRMLHAAGYGRGA